MTPIFPINHAERKHGKKTADGKVEKYIVFNLGKDSYVTVAPDVLEVLMIPELLKVDNSPIPLEGAANIRGNVIPVIDISKILGVDSPAGSNPLQRLVVFQSRGKPVGLLADGVDHRLVEIPLSIVRNKDDQGFFEFSDAKYKLFVIEDVITKADQKKLDKLQKAL